MAKKINFYSFILSLICVGLFLSTSFTSVFKFFDGLFKVHPLTIVLILSTITFLLGMFGFGGVSDWKSFARSFMTVLLTLALLGVLVLIIGVGNFLG